MKVGVNARTLSVDEPSGSVQIGYNVIEELSKRSDLDVVVFGHNTLSDEFDAPVVSTGFTINSQVYGLFWERTILPKIATRSNIDILYSPNANAPAYETPFKNVITYHDVNALAGYADKKYKILRKVLIPRSLARADRVVTVSEFSKSEILSYFEIPEEKLCVIYNGIDPFYLSNDPGERINLPDNFILFTGSLNPRKNIKGVIEAYDRYRKEYTDEYELVLVGPNNKSIFKDFDVGAGEHIHLKGYLSKEELKYTYRSADLFLYPSYYEGFGLPPLEAMANKTPVIASNTSAMPEVLADAALLINPDDSSEIVAKMNAVFSNNCLYDQLIREGVALSNQYTWSNAVGELVDIFKRLTA